MFFKKKNKKEMQCNQCKEKYSDKFNFCPYCGLNRVKEENAQDLGMLGKRDLSEEELAKNSLMSQNLNGFDRMIVSVMNTLMKNMFNELEKTEVRNSPHGIKIKIGVPTKKPIRENKQQTRTMSEEQIQRISSLPREKAKTNVKRLNDKVIYELHIPGILSPDDIFVSRLESGYEIKAIGQEKKGEEKIYFNSVPVTLPIKSFTINPDKLLIEFSHEQQ